MGGNSILIDPTLIQAEGALEKLSLPLVGVTVSDESVDGGQKQPAGAGPHRPHVNFPSFPPWRLGPPHHVPTPHHVRNLKHPAP